MTEFFMKVIVALAALATVIASPAFAQAPWQGYRWSYGAYAGAPYWAYGAYAPAPGLAFARPYVVRPFSVYDTRGNYVGSDPDPRVRFQLHSDPTQGD
jgi:hypothetical protein